MKRHNIIVATSALALLTACADLGFGDFPMAEMIEGEPGAVTVAELSTAGIAAPAPNNFGPPNAKPGECYARVEVPGKSSSRTKQVLVSPATTKVETIPAKFKTVEEQVLVTPATTKTEVVPATYKSVTRQVPVDNPVEVTSESSPREGLCHRRGSAWWDDSGQPRDVLGCHVSG